MIDLEVIERSIIEFQGNSPKELISCGIVTNGRKIKYYFLMNDFPDEDLEGDLLVILQDILSSLGVIQHSGSIDYKYDISYKIITTKKEFIDKMNSSMYLVYLASNNIDIRENITFNFFSNKCTLNVCEITILLNEIVIGYLDYNENFIVRDNNNLITIKLRLKSKSKYDYLLDLINNNLFFSTNKEKIEFDLIEINYHNKKVIGFLFKEPENELEFICGNDEKIIFQNVVQFEIDCFSNQNILLETAKYRFGNIPKNVIENFSFLEHLLEFYKEKNKQNIFIYSLISLTGLRGVVVTDNGQ